MLAFTVKLYGEEALERAAWDYTLGGKYNAGRPYLESIVIPWMLFNWRPQSRGRDKDEKPRALNAPLALMFLKENASQLTGYQQAFIRAACAQPFSFFGVTDVVEGKSIELQDILLDRRFTVREASASRTVREGDILFARVLPLEGQTILFGVAPVIIPPRFHLKLLDLQEGLQGLLRKFSDKLRVEFLLAGDEKLREFYFDCVEAITHPPVPKLQNTDGDPLSFVKLFFELDCSPQEALDGLRSMILKGFEDHFDELVHDSSGNLIKIRFPWQKKGNKQHKHWDNTVLGHITIDGRALTAEVNSEKRAKKIQAEITKRLGETVTFKRAVHESPEQMLAKARKRSGSQPLPRPLEQALDIASRPEVRAMLQEQMKAHWEAWYAQPIPALKNQSPLDAAKTPEGRKRLDALLTEFERHNENLPQQEIQADIPAMRKRLGL